MTEQQQIEKWKAEFEELIDKNYIIPKKCYRNEYWSNLVHNRW